MTMSLFLQSLGLNILTLALPIGLAVYFGFRGALKHGELKIGRKKELTKNEE